MHSSPWKSAWRGAPGRPRGALAASQVSFTGRPLHPSCLSCQQDPWPGAHLGLVGSQWVASGGSWQFGVGVPPHVPAAGFGGLCKALTNSREPNPSRGFGRNAEAVFSYNMRYYFIFNNLLRRENLGDIICQGNRMQPMYTARMPSLCFLRPA